MGYHNILSQICLFTIMPSLLLPSAHGIRVHWNTNTGPIVPPTSTPAPIPSKPYREPAPVWEHIPDDIPNPTPYQYVPPPPARPPMNNVNIFSNNVDNKPQPIEQRPQPHLNYGRVINNISQNSNYNNVPSLAVQYIPNYGFKYYAVVPDHKSAYLKSNEIQAHQQHQYNKYYYNNKYDKYQEDKFNAKLRKYKDYKKYMSAVQSTQQPTYQQTQQQPQVPQHQHHHNQHQQPTPVQVQQQPQQQQPHQPQPQQQQQQQNYNSFTNKYSQNSFNNNNKL